MRTNIEINDELMRQALDGSGSRTKKEVVEAALRLLVQVHGQTGIRRLRGKVEFFDDIHETRPGKF